MLTSSFLKPVIKKSKNLFDKTKYTPDVFVRVDNPNLGELGSLSPTSSGNLATDYIEIKPNKKYVGTNLRNAQSAGIAFYDKNKVYLGSTQSSVFVTPSGAFYLRATINIADIETAQIEEGGVATAYATFNQQLKTAKQYTSGNLLNGSIANSTGITVNKQDDYFIDFSWTGGINVYPTGKDGISIDVKQNTTYTFSYEVASDAGNDIGIAIRDTLNNIIATPTLSVEGKRRYYVFSTALNAKIKVQLFRTQSAGGHSVVKNWCLLEGSGNEFIPYKEKSKTAKVPKLVKGKVKQPIYKLPFTFERKGKVYSNKVVVQDNQPRLTEDGEGIIMENAYENLLWQVTSLGTNGGYVSEETSEYARYTNTVAGNFRGLFLRNNIPIVGGQTYRFGARFMRSYNARTTKLRMEHKKADGSATTTFEFPFSGDTTDDQLQFVTYQAPADAVTCIPTIYMWDATIGEELIVYKDYMLLQGTTPTFVVDGVKNKEIMSFSPGQNFIETEGAIEVDITCLRGEGQNYLQGNTYGLHDIVYYTTGRGFIVRRNYDSANRITLATTDSYGYVQQKHYSYAWKNGETLKYRIEWSKSQNFVKLYLNGQMILSNYYWLDMPDNYPLQIASRGLYSEGYGSSDGIVRNLKIYGKNDRLIYTF